MAVFAALLAVFLQAFAIQTHVHAFGVAGPSAYAQAAGEAALSSDAVHVTAADHQTICAVCEAFANSGRAALPEAPVIAAQTNAAYETAALEIRRVPRALTHSWQSRAPPIAV